MKENSKQNILIVSGEHSGDLLGGSLLENFSKDEFNFFGIGGESMIAQGFHSIKDIESLNVMGFTGILSKYFELKKIAFELVEKSIELNIKFAILIDYPGFNLFLAERLKEKGIKIIFYVSPQIWAWRFNRIHRIKKCVDLMLLLFPFEKKIYDEFGINSKFVGHPLADRMKEKLKTEENFPLNPNSKKICIMPGSRKGEIRRLLKPILESLRLLKMNLADKFDFDFFLPNINKQEESFILNLIQEYSELKIQYFFDKTARCIHNSDVVIVASGTATLEVTYFEKPMVILYKMSLVTFLIGKSLVRTKNVGLVNILFGDEICKELIQFDCTPIKIMNEVKHILQDDAYRTNMISNLNTVKLSLGSDAGKKCSEAILEWIQT